jgi:signal peptidase
MTRKRSLGFIVAALLVIGLVGTGLTFWLHGYRVYVVHTGSMEPTYMPGDIVVDKPAASTLHKGEVITFLHSEDSDDVVTHRFVGYTSNGLIHTKGDANRTPDAWEIRPDQVKGQALFEVPGLGYLLVYFRNPEGIASLATGVLAIALLWGFFFPAEGSTAADESAPARPSPLPRGPRPRPSHAAA